MSLPQFYGGLAIAASVFVGILTAYLVTRLSDLKSERSRLRQRIESIDAELEVLKTRHEFRIDQLEETENKWELDEAEEEVDNFIDYTVGRKWSPSPEEVTVEDTLDALIEYRNLTSDELIQHHREVIEQRWDEIMDELEPSGTMMGAVVDTTVEEYEAANWIIDALWKIYEREKYDTHDSEVLNIQRRVDELIEERERLEERYNSLNPEQLRESIKFTIVPIILSVIIPLIARFFHEVELQLSAFPNAPLIEPITVSVLWLIGFFWTLGFVWRQVTGTHEDLPTQPILKQDSDTGS